MKIDRKMALKILREEALASQVTACDEGWKKQVDDLSRACDIENKTFIAMLGTAILAKATHAKVDPFSLKAGKKKDTNSYSARSLCKDVLAAHAPELGIDLGVSGREPLNNQPFFAKDRVTKDLPIKPAQALALSLLLGALGILDSMTHEEQAKVALRAFLKARIRPKREISIALDDGDSLSEIQLLGLIKYFVSENSERGKRAQAVAAGLLDVHSSYSRIKISAVHDPDKNFPGDIGILSSFDSSDLERIFEVRDKPVLITDLHHLIDKAMKFGVSKVGMVAVHSKQEIFDLSGIAVWAAERDVNLAVYFGWEAFVKEAIFWSSHQGKLNGLVYRSILKRIPEYEVSSKGSEIWESKTVLC